MIQLEFDRGTLLVRDPENRLEEPEPLPGVSFDERVGLWRAAAHAYRNIILALRRRKLEYEDKARDYQDLPLQMKHDRQPYPHQAEAVEAWWKAGQCGVVVLPTGAGKTYVAQLMMQKVQRSALVVTPTIDLMNQWYTVLSAAFGIPVGLLGGGEYDVQPVTVTTYDSAYLHMERLGNKFGLLVFDECHHLPGPSYVLSAEASLAPFRVGLTATPERADNEHWRYQHLIGPIVYRKEIKELAGEYLSDYQTVILTVELSEAERELYQSERQIYKDFIANNRIDFSRANGWATFIALSSRSPEGRRAFQAHRTQKNIAQASEAKIRLLETLLRRHSQDRVIIFTSDNRTVYHISRRFLIPAITHQTKIKERHAYLQGFNSGEYPFLATSRVLNEGVDVPAANVGIVLSGSGSVREHVQRLGRILRRAEGKEALLYEVVAEDTAEEYVSQRRTRHSAYQ